MIGASGPKGPVEHDAARGYADRRYKRRQRDPVGIIIHTTGAAPWRRWDQARERWSSPHDAAKFIYQNITNAAPHFVVCGETGKVTQMCPLEYAAWHTGGAGSWRYRRRAFQGLPLWWRERWPELKGPGDLLDGQLWSAGSANKLTVGIEVSPPFDHPRGPWTSAGWTSLTWLVQYLAGDLGIIIDPFHVFTHSDAHPRNRTTDGGRPWDPGANQWSGRGAVGQMAMIRFPRS